MEDGALVANVTMSNNLLKLTRTYSSPHSPLHYLDDHDNAVLVSCDVFDERTTLIAVNLNQAVVCVRMAPIVFEANDLLILSAVQATLTVGNLSTDAFLLGAIAAVNVNLADKLVRMRAHLENRVVKPLSDPSGGDVILDFIDFDL